MSTKVCETWEKLWNDDPGSERLGKKFRSYETNSQVSENNLRKEVKV
jgi:hypothetical protein